MKQLSYIVFLSLLFFACKKHDSPNPVDDLPPETQTGMNTFGCVVNARAWVPRVPLGLRRLYAGYYRETLSIHATLRHDGRDQRIDLYIDSLFRPGAFILYKLSGTGMWEGPSVHFSSSPCGYNTDDANLLSSAEVEMTRVDTINRIFSGRFKFKFSALGGICDTILVTHGRFDVVAE